MSGVSLLEAVVLVMCARRLGRGSRGCGWQRVSCRCVGGEGKGGGVGLGEGPRWRGGITSH